MKKIHYLFKVSLEKNVKELYRYKFNTISNFLILYILFMVMFSGLKSFGMSLGVSPLDMGENLEGFIVGYFLWTIIMVAYSDIAFSIIDDASKGTLEQLNMSNINLSQILIVRSISNLLIETIFSIFLLLIIMKTTGHWLEINVLSILIPIFIGVFSILGIGLMCGGLALIFKRVQSLLNIIQYFLIVLVATFPRSRIISGLLPFNYAAGSIFSTMMGGCSFRDFSALDYGIMVGNSLLYFIIGLFVFNQCVKVAKRRGLLGQY
ncbi:ABC transporter permease [Sporanaerobacter acetigenes]|uniref:ABC-2 type transport system permease protein n=1 Tax=Sporanaerobacter acetigenes DSM 13106 TaxID=1123281 RepID=A0A1M5WMI0_9FIRM|nr:ABC transporter permease [Sporanaerobacter acetigenes]SHH88726.1 ABC-2 type transport system permease protein [Sporanaerobacter acetigenes DSM 13106]